MPQPPHAGRAWLVLALLCLTYIFSQFYRNSTGVIGPELMRDLALRPEALGLLSSAFFIGLSLIQLPAGLLLDRNGPRMTIFPMMALAVAGSLWFAAGTSLFDLASARFVMGLGCAAAYVGGVAAIARWFPPEQFAMASSVLLAAGNLGALMSTTPLAFATEQVGWRASFMILAGALAVVASIGFLIVRDAPTGHDFLERKRESLFEVLIGLRDVVTHGGFIRILVVGFVTYPMVMAILALWGGPYLYDVHGLDTVARGNVLLVLSGATILGYLVYGQLDRLLDTRKWLLVGGLIGAALCLVALGLAPRLPVWAIAGLLALFGLFSSFNAVSIAHARALFPARFVGRMASIYNLVVQAGVAVVQLASAWLIGLFGGAVTGAPEVAYRAMFLFLAAIAIGALFVYLPIPDAKPSDSRAD